jgi:hypothetical protein
MAHTDSHGLIWVTSPQADRLARAVTMYLEMFDGSHIANPELRRRYDEMKAAREEIDQN